MERTRNTTNYMLFNASMKMGWYTYRCKTGYIFCSYTEKNTPITLTLTVHSRENTPITFSLLPLILKETITVHSRAPLSYTLLPLFL